MRDHLPPTVEELEQLRDDLKDRIKTLHDGAFGRRFSEEERDAWNELNGEHDAVEERLLEKRAARKRVAELSRDARNVEDEESLVARTGTYLRRQDQPEYRYRALQAADRLHGEGELPESGVVKLDEVIRRDEIGEDSRYVAAASDENYRTAWRKLMVHGRDAFFTNPEREAVAEVQSAQWMRAASLTGTAGGYAVPTALDPSVIATSDGSLNPLRRVARTLSVTTYEWRGVSSDGITAAYSAEAASASDNAPTLAQPTAYVEKAQAWIPYSIEVGEDWALFEEEIAKMMQDAKDYLESVQFLTGLGHSSHVPEGLLVGATRAVTTGSTATVEVDDIYSLKAALPTRFQERASVLANTNTLDAFRRLAGPGNTSELPVWSDQPPRLLRLPAYALSSYDDIASGATVATVGDFTNFLILDRIGMQLEPVRHVFSGGVPTGQRGTYAWFRSGSKVLTENAFQSLVCL